MDGGISNHMCADNASCDDIGFLLWQIMKIWQRGKHRMLDEFGITAPQMEILSSVHHLSITEAEVTQIMISNLTLVDPMTTSTILRNLEKKDLITRKASETDTRARIVEITEEGINLLVKAKEKIKAETEKLSVSINEDILKQELRNLLNILTELNNPK